MAGEWWTEHCRSKLAAIIQKQNVDLAAARAEIERRGRELNLAKYGEPDFSWSIHKEAMSELLARAEKAEAERDEAMAQVKAAYAYGWRDGNHPDAREMPVFAQSALEAYGREKWREGMRRAADLIDQNFDRNGWSAHKAILAEMETLK